MKIDRNQTIIQWSLLAPYLVITLLTIFALLIGIVFSSFSFQDAGQGKIVLLFWTFYNLLVLGITVLAFVELPRQETHIADQPEATTLKIDGNLLPVLIQSLTQDTLCFSGLSHPLGTVGSILLQGIGDVRFTVIAKTFDGARLRLQATPKQKKALILRFYTEGGAPGVSSLKATALFKDFTKRFSASE